MIFEKEEIVIKTIQNRIQLNDLRRKIFNEMVEKPDENTLTAKEMLNYEDRFLRELLTFLTGDSK